MWVGDRDLAALAEGGQGAGRRDPDAGRRPALEYQKLTLSTSVLQKTPSNVQALDGVQRIASSNVQASSKYWTASKAKA